MNIERNRNHGVRVDSISCFDCERASVVSVLLIPVDACAIDLLMTVGTAASSSQPSGHLASVLRDISERDVVTSVPFMSVSAPSGAGFPMAQRRAVGPSTGTATAPATPSKPKSLFAQSVQRNKASDTFNHNFSASLSSTARTPPNLLDHEDTFDDEQEDDDDEEYMFGSGDPYGLEGLGMGDIHQVWLFFFFPAQCAQQ
jgi:hypothetical protein